METERFVFPTLSTYPQNLELIYTHIYSCEEVEIREIAVPWDNWYLLVGSDVSLREKGLGHRRGKRATRGLK